MKAPTGTVARTVRVMRALAEAGEPLTVAELGRRLGLPRPTVHRLLGLLAAEGIVASDGGGRYEVGREYRRLAALVGARRDRGRA